jgi:hypothetical protein
MDRTRHRKSIIDRTLRVTLLAFSVSHRYTIRGLVSVCVVVYEPGAVKRRQGHALRGGITGHAPVPRSRRRRASVLAQLHVDESCPRLETNIVVCGDDDDEGRGTSSHDCCVCRAN